MKKIALFIIALLVLLSVAADLPPALPSSIYGYTPAAGVVSVYIGARQVATAKTTLYQGKPVYSVDVPMDGVAPGTLASIRFNGRPLATVELASGTNQNVNLAQPRFWRWR